MKERPSQRLSSEDARKLWERAMEMQLEAARRSEERALEAGDSSEESDVEEGGFTSDEVAAAAREAGISEEFVAVALAEMQVEKAEGRGPEGRIDRAADRLLDDPRKSLRVSRTVAAEPEAVMSAMQELVPDHPYHLTFRDMTGSDPFEDGILTFKGPGWSEYSSKQSPFTTALLYGEVDLLLVTIRSSDVAEPGESSGATSCTEIIITAPLRKSRRSQWWWTTLVGAPVSLGAGVGGVFLGLSLAAAFPPALAIAAAAIPGLAAAGATGAGNVWAFRRLYHWGVTQAEAALNDLLADIENVLHSEVTFRKPKPRTGSGWMGLSG